MRVLLLYQFLNHTSLVGALADHMRPQGIEIDCLDLPTLTFISGEKGRLTIYRTLYSIWEKIGKLRRVFSVFFKSKYIMAQIRDYDVIDIHSYDLYYNTIIPKIKKSGKPLIIMVWGSDFYRASKEALDKKRLGFALADIIHLESETVKEDFLKVYPEFEGKIRIVQFGLNQLDLLRDEMKNLANQVTVIPNDNYKGKLIVTCGYNGIESQQHIAMIDALANMQDTLKEKIYVLVPFTYGWKPEYKEKVINRLNLSGLPYTLLDQRLTDLQITELRMISKIVINIQITDSFSASLQEHMMAESVMIVGDWLPYKVFDDAGIFMIKTDMYGLQSKIEEAILHYDVYKMKSINNSNKVYNLSSWSGVSSRWISIYRESIKA